MTHPTPTLDEIANLIGSGHAALAATEADRLRQRLPQDPEAARLHGIALLQLGRIDDARAALEQALALAPASVEVLCNLGSVLLAAGDPARALDTLETAARIAPAHPAVLNGLGNARRASGDGSGARDAYAAATRAAPAYLGGWCNLAAAELALGEHGAAERAAREAVARASRHPEALLVLGHALAAQQRHADARDAYEAGARSAPRDARFAYHAGLMEEELGQPALAATAHARALELAPQLDQALAQLVFLRRRLCAWDGLDALSARLQARVGDGAPGIAPFGFLAESAGAALQRRCATTHANAIERAVAPLRARQPLQHARAAAQAPLRVGFMANGFGNHPTALLVVAFIEALRDEALELHLYSTAADDGSVLMQRLRSAAHAWHDVAASPAEAIARHVHADGIEILIDVDGYCQGSRPEAFALRPAPVQVNWLAYPGTLGAPWIDYVIADEIVLPRGLWPHFSEHVAWLPRCFQPSDTTRQVTAPAPRAQHGLPDGAIVYACFNNSYKLNSESFARLLAVLREVPSSVLWLLDGPDRANDRLREVARREGIDPARLVFGPSLPHEQHLARYAHADLFLDTAPYGAHTTASDAIWAGCPVLTCAGDVFAARVAASLNHHLGQPALNAADAAAFVAAAVHLGRDSGARAQLRARVAEARVHSGLFDMKAYARDFASLLRRMAERLRAGQPPAPLE
jgi:predicted O-linked N-acetylglucosamine transferase (SPINDLY family)